MGLTRGELFARVGLLREIEPLVVESYAFYERLQRGESDRGHGREHDWHVSFHGSAFPGDSDIACGRQQLYRMMDIPREPFGRRGRQFVEMGKDFEDALVWKWYWAGRLLSAPPNKEQTQYEDPDVWLTTSTDAIVLPTKRHSSGVVCEVKEKFARDLDAMKSLIRDPDFPHVKQVKCQIGMAHENIEGWRVKRCFNTGRIGIDQPYGCSEPLDIGVVCPQHKHTDCLREEEIAPPDCGYLYYASRDDPVDTWEFYFDYDAAFMAAGRSKLAQWREAFENEILPQTQFAEKRFSHPFGWTWTMSKKMPNSPCQYCDFGAICRDDHKLAVKKGAPISLRESEAIVAAKEQRPDYDFDRVKAAVLSRWGVAEAVSEAA
jgi:hypothetical protein